VREGSFSRLAGQGQRSSKGLLGRKQGRNGRGQTLESCRVRQIYARARFPTPCWGAMAQNCERQQLTTLRPGDGYSQPFGCATPEAMWKVALAEVIVGLEDGAIPMGHSVGGAILINRQFLARPMRGDDPRARVKKHTVGSQVRIQ
jgi:hypothetical protein